MTAPAGAGLLVALESHHAVVSVLSFTADVSAVSKSNHRHDLAGKKDWKRFAGFEELVSTYARVALPASWPVLDRDVPLAARPLVVVSVVASSVVDAANLPKSVTDALEGVCFVNDASARAVSSITRRSKSPGFAVVAVACGTELSRAAAPERTLAEVSALSLSAATELFLAAFPDTRER